MGFYSILLLVNYLCCVFSNPLRMPSSYFPASQYGTWVWKGCYETASDRIFLPYVAGKNDENGYLSLFSCQQWGLSHNMDVIGLYFNGQCFGGLSSNLDLNQHTLIDGKCTDHGNIDGIQIFQHVTEVIDDVPCNDTFPYPCEPIGEELFYHMHNEEVSFDQRFTAHQKALILLKLSEKAEKSKQTTFRINGEFIKRQGIKSKIPEDILKSNYKIDQSRRFEYGSSACKQLFSDVLNDTQDFGLYGPLPLFDLPEDIIVEYTHGGSIPVNIWMEDVQAQSKSKANVETESSEAVKDLNLSYTWSRTDLVEWVGKSYCFDNAVNVAYSRDVLAPTIDFSKIDEYEWVVGRDGNVIPFSKKFYGPCHALLPPKNESYYYDKRKYEFEGSEGVVIGSIHPWAEASFLDHGVKHITTIEYIPINTTDIDPSVLTAFTPRDVAQLYLNNEWKPVDFIFSYSSLEHSGLGRYGDQINPNGDLIEMAKAMCLLKPKTGVVLVGVPTGPDYLSYNTHRVYGRHRLPKLFKGLKVVDVLGGFNTNTHAPNLKTYTEPIFVLSNDADYI